MNDVTQAIAEALQPLAAVVPGLQITPLFNQNPTPPSIDIYPAPDGFLERSAMGIGSWQAVFVARVRVNSTDSDAGQEFLLQLMDPRNNTGSLIVTLAADPTLGGVVDDSTVEFPSGYTEYSDPATGGTMLGCNWRIRVILQ